jgi:hypothetical protein
MKFGTVVHWVKVGIEFEDEPNRSTGSPVASVDMSPNVILCDFNALFYFSCINLDLISPFSPNFRHVAIFDKLSFLPKFRHVVSFAKSSSDPQFRLILLVVISSKFSTCRNFRKIFDMASVTILEKYLTCKT